MSTQVNLENIDRIGDQIRKKLTKGMILSINGPLGVGKTTLIKSILKEYQVSSPSFLHMLFYGEDFAHIDAYMIKSQESFLTLDLNDILEQRCLIVEWGDLVKDAIQLFERQVLELELSMHNEERILIWK
jgi:tRNA threonylcarbamoyl adenosine modification protein YjeE